jgi:hypothetical protein
MTKKRVTNQEKLEYIDSIDAHLQSLDDVVKATKCGVSSLYKWIEQRSEIEQRVSDGLGDKVRVVVKKYQSRTPVKTLPSKYTPRLPSEQLEEANRVLEWLAGSPAGSISLKELLHQFSRVPNFPNKTTQAQIAFVRRIVHAHGLHERVSFTIKRHQTTRSPPRTKPKPLAKKKSYDSPIRQDHVAKRMKQSTAVESRRTSSISQSPPPSFALFPSAPPSHSLPAVPSVPLRPAWLQQTADGYDNDVSSEDDCDNYVQELLDSYDSCEYSEPESETRMDPGANQESDEEEKSCISISSTEQDDVSDGPTPAIGDTVTNACAAPDAILVFNYVGSNLYSGDGRMREHDRDLLPLGRCPPNRQCKCWMHNIGQPCSDTMCPNVTNFKVCPTGCLSGPRCGNQGFNEYTVEAEHRLFQTFTKGVGVKTIAPVKQGEFVMEYVGEIIGKVEYLRRFQRMAESNATCYYFMEFAYNMYVDTILYGNHSRYINHSCEPNCIAEVWIKDGKKRCSITAIVDIDADVELTFNYKWTAQVKSKAFVCKCGSTKCTSRLLEFQQ